MKSRFALYIALSIPLVLLATCGRSEQKSVSSGMSCEHHATIHVTAKGLEHTQGQVLVALFAAKDGFPSKIDKAIQQGVAHMESTFATYTFTPVPQGDYAVSVLHDEDGDGAMKTAAFGRPAEGWGVSNDAKASFGPPKFRDATFSALEDSVAVELNLRY